MTRLQAVHRSISAWLAPGARVTATTTFPSVDYGRWWTTNKGQIPDDGIERRAERSCAFIADVVPSSAPSRVNAPRCDNGKKEREKKKENITTLQIYT